MRCVFCDVAFEHALEAEPCAMRALDDGEDGSHVWEEDPEPAPPPLDPEERARELLDALRRGAAVVLTKELASVADGGRRRSPSLRLER